MVTMSYYIKADRYLLEKEERIGGYLQIEQGRFGPFTNTLPPQAELIDWSGYTLAPGLFDTHIHGVKGYDVMDGTVEAIEKISSALLPLGVTRFLPTTLTSSSSDLENALQATSQAVKRGLPGAQSEGIFLEGPYFTEAYKGAQNAAFFRNPSWEEFSRWQKLANDQIIKIAIAPEREGAIDFIHQVRKENVTVSIAHTDASFTCCQQAIEAGATVFVHLFNGMSGMHHRKPGVVGAALIEDTTFSELICDGHHVHPSVAVLALRMKQEKLILITDCMRAALMPDGNYTLGDFQVEMKNHIARTQTGSLAGSTLQLIKGVKNLSNWSSHALHEIWHLASLSPARSIGKGDTFGSIQRGKVADFVVVDDGLEVQMTAIQGEIKFVK